MAKLSVSDKLIIAASRLEKNGRSQMTAEDLVVAAWKAFPETFGLAGHTDDGGIPLYPDSNRVFAEIMGSKPVRRNGLLVKVGAKVYELTESGRERVRALTEHSDESASSTTITRSTVGRDVVRRLTRLLSSKAYGKKNSGNVDQITFHDACVFWGIGPHSSAIELRGRLADTSTIINSALKAAESGRTGSSHGGAGFTIESIRELQSLHELLLARFPREIQTIEKRTDQRVW